MTNEELIHCFENNVMPDDSFHHADHVRLAFAYLCQYPVLQALDKFANAALPRDHHLRIFFLDPGTDGSLRGRRLAEVCSPKSRPAYLEEWNSEPLLLRNYFEIRSGANRIRFPR